MTVSRAHGESERAPDPPSDERRLDDAAIVQRLSDVVLRYDREGRIRFANEAIRQLAGYGPAHYIGRLATEVSPDAEVAQPLAAAREAAEAESAR